MEDYYEILGVDKNASKEEIKSAYRKLSKKYHPDINKEDGAEDQYKKIQTAYETLGNENKRKEYDTYGSSGNPFGQGFGQGQGEFKDFSQFGDFGDIFSQFFGGGVDPNAPRKGNDLQYRIVLSFDESLQGKKQKISYERLNSQGVSEKNTIEISIPAGIDNGQQVRMSGQGESGVNGGPNGDLFIVVNVRPSDEGFERQGDNIFSEEHIDIFTAIQGGEISIKTPYGPGKLKIPSGTQSHTNFRLRDNGAPIVGQNSKGYLNVRTIVDIPTKINSEQNKILEELKKSFSKKKKKGLFG